jgi:hypothetical protein
MNFDFVSNLRQSQSCETFYRVQSVYRSTIATEEDIQTRQIVYFQMYFPVGSQSAQVFPERIILSTTAQQTTQSEHLQERRMG